MSDEEQGILFAPETYRELCKPFDSPESANAAFHEFQKELYDLRCKHRITDLLWCAQVNIKYEDGKEGTPTAICHFGDENKAESMAAHAYGYLSAQRQERVLKLLSEKQHAVRTPRSRK